MEHDAQYAQILSSPFRYTRTRKFFERGPLLQKKIHKKAILSAIQKSCAMHMILKVTILSSID